MLYFTLISRLSDSLSLAADTVDTSCANAAALEQNKMTGKNLLRKLSATAGGNIPLLSVESAQYSYHVLTENGVQFLTMTDKNTAAMVAFAYLEDVAREFLVQYGDSVGSATRPYCFIKFDIYLQKTKQIFSSSTAAKGAVMQQRSGKGQQPVKKKFSEVMGYGEPGTKDQGGRGGSDVGRSAVGGDNMVVFVGVGVLVVIVLIGFLIFLLA